MIMPDNKKTRDLDSRSKRSDLPDRQPLADNKALGPQPTTMPMAESPPPPTKTELLQAEIARLKAKVAKLPPEEQKVIAEDIADVAERESEPSKLHLKRLTATLDGIVAGSQSLQNMHKQQLREYAKTFLSRLGV